MGKNTIVLYPSPAVGHLISMVELGKFILKHQPSFSIIVLITIPPYHTETITPVLKRLSETTSSIHFYHLPLLSLPLDSSTNSPHFETLVFKLLRMNTPHVEQALQTISQTSTIQAFIFDVFCFSALQVADSLNIPAFYFYTSGIASLSLFLFFSTFHHKNITTKNAETIDFNSPGVPPISPSDMPKVLLDHTSEAYQEFLYCSSQIPKSKGIIVNSFESLEPRALEAISNGLCVPHAPTPPVYCIGPLIATEGRDHECLSWLDAQPSRSVVFLCFGSLGSFSQEQLIEIATGLERSDQRFLWVVRNPPSKDELKSFTAPAEPDLDVLLPEGFFNRIRGKGLVIKSWAPQVEILSKDSVGGFVTHCGWNSVLEAICAGVPMVGWPLYAEQRMNRVFLVEEMKLALPMEDSEGGFVDAEEVEKRVRELMESDEGKMLRERTLRMQNAAKVAMTETGSSFRALTKLTELWMQ
ncbi:Udp-glycosyltransferase 88b1 [Thalictrum thalictroides]|uniref:Glycosyltransferase n=1 Tax=Thalictrum thalictroides TaxID=46969 RepID=A0A7J6V2F5_THATH|nr:Udp-glycosyltransferase 88b1 [Thalictrum thalictroides]